MNREASLAVNKKVSDTRIHFGSNTSRFVDHTLAFQDTKFSQNRIKLDPNLDMTFIHSLDYGSQNCCLRAHSRRMVC